MTAWYTRLWIAGWRAVPGDWHVNPPRKQAGAACRHLHDMQPHVHRNGAIANLCHSKWTSARLVHAYETGVWHLEQPGSILGWIYMLPMSHLNLLSVCSHQSDRVLNADLPLMCGWCIATCLSCSLSKISTCFTELQSRWPTHHCGFFSLLKFVLDVVCRCTMRWRAVTPPSCMPPTSP